MHKTYAQDAYYMMLAIAQAEQGIYTARPNPTVGCILVKDDEIVGRGFHPKAGQAHAEVFALEEAQFLSKGATAYVTLEPCSHIGRTPPCADALINAGIKRVVIAGLDPNPKVAGCGVQRLQQAGIEVHVGIATDKAELLNKGFLKAMRSKMPYVRLKIAASIDGRTAMASGESKWITGAAARHDVQRLRAISGAIITGSETIIQDDPQLNVRSSQLGVPSSEVPQPMVVVLDRRQRLTNRQKDFKVFHNKKNQLYHDHDLIELLTSLVEEHQIYDVLIEAGSQVSGSFIRLGLVDEIIIYQAPCFLGHTGRPMLDLAIDNLSHQYRFSIESVTQLSEDNKIVLTPYVNI